VPELALGLLVLYAGLTLGVRMAAHRRRTGSTGFIGAGDSAAERAVALLFVAAYGALGAAPVLDLTGTLDPLGGLDGTAGHVVGTIVAAVGIAAVAYSQGAMGRSWRIGVDPSERTDLVTGGPFTVARNPIYTAMIFTYAGFALLVPNPAMLPGLVAMVVALELQTRVVEEPYLLRTHGEQYARYAARVGRFLPGVGKLTPTESPAP